MEKCNTLTVIVNGIPKLIEVESSIRENVITAYQQSNLYGIGGTTIAKFEDMCAAQLQGFRKDEDESRAMAFCRAFDIDSVHSPLMVKALWLVETQVNSSREITMDMLIKLLELENEKNPAILLEEDFNANFWHERFLSSNLRIGFCRFCKLFRAEIEK